MEVRVGLLLLLVPLLLGLVETTEVLIPDKCTVARVEDCIQPVANLTAQAQYLFPPLTMEEYRNTCITFTKVLQCLEKMALNHCPPAANKALRDAFSLLQFMCFSQEDQYSEIGPGGCFRGILLRSEIELCTQRYMGVPQAMRDKANPTTKEEDSFCSLTVDVLYCRYLVVDDHCGKEAARWQHEAHTAALAYVLERFKCKVELDINFDVERTNLGYIMLIFIALLLLCSFPMRKFVCPKEAKIRQAHQQEKRQSIANDIVRNAA